MKEAYILELISWREGLENLILRGHDESKGKHRENNFTILNKSMNDYDKDKSK